MSTEASSKVRVKTTLPLRPLPCDSDSPIFQTERLSVWRLKDDDLQGLHELRTQPEVMRITTQGRVDRDHIETRAFMELFMAPQAYNNYFLAIKLSSTNEIIGMGGNHRDSQFGWPEVGYILKSQHWGMGYATEFLRGFLDAWWALQRGTVEIEVDKQSVDSLDEVPERLSAIVHANNPASLGVMSKCGFRKFKEWDGPDPRPGREGQFTSYVGFIATAKLQV